MKRMVISLFFLVCASVWAQEKIEDTYQYDVAVVLIFQNEGPYIKEWIEYYRLLGATHFYFYNNLSTDNYLEVLEPYLDSGLIELFVWPPEGADLGDWWHVQNKCYVDALDRSRKDRVKWLAIVDSDEFLVPRKVDTLREFLADYENDTIAAVRAWWVLFGTSNVEKIPDDKLLIETLLLNDGYDNVRWKSVVRPDRLDPDQMGNVHRQVVLPGFEDQLLSTEEIQCNHYWTRDLYYLNNFKIPRRIQHGFKPKFCTNMYKLYNKGTEGTEPILRFVPALRLRMGLD